MKGGLFVILYSMFLIGLFVLSCFLMSTVNPKPISNTIRRLDTGEDTITAGPFPKKYHTGYGLEKIPEGVDADEYRRTTITTYYYDVGRESGQKVSPPIWPKVARRDFEGESNKARNKSLPKNLYDSTSPPKGRRRSVGDHKRGIGIENPGSILLKVIDDNGQNKIEIRIISKDKMKAKRMRPNRSFDKIQSNQSFDLFVNESGFNEINGSKEGVIKMKRNDVIVLTIADDPDQLLEKDVASETESMKYVDEMADSSSKTNFSLNSVTNNISPELNLQEAEKDLKKIIINNEMYTVNLLSNSDSSDGKMYSNVLKNVTLNIS